MTQASPIKLMQTPGSLEEFEAVIRAIRPKLHRYCARMAGSVIDGEDVLQITLIKAFEALMNDKTNTHTTEVQNIEAWLFRIAHNSTMDYFRTQARQAQLGQQVAMKSPEEVTTEPTILSDDLKHLSVLPPLQRSVLLLRDLLGYSGEEVADIMEMSVSAVKSALHRAREAAKKVSVINPASNPSFSESDILRAKVYAELFNLRDFDQLRHLLQREVKLDLIDKSRRTGKEKVGNYFGNYNLTHDWYMEVGTIENQLAILAFDKKDSSLPPQYFILLEYQGQQLSFIKDFRYARYVMESAIWQRIHSA
ncbi:MAG: RNA polymerase sigma factor [Bermanella sp.]